MWIAFLIKNRKRTDTFANRIAAKGKTLHPKTQKCLTLKYKTSKFQQVGIIFIPRIQVPTLDI